MVSEALEDSLSLAGTNRTGWSSWLWGRIESNYQCCGLPGRVEHSHWSRSIDILSSDWLDHPVSYAIKNMLKAPNAPFLGL